MIAVDCLQCPDKCRSTAFSRVFWSRMELCTGMPFNGICTLDRMSFLICYLKGPHSPSLESQRKRDHFILEWSMSLYREEYYKIYEVD
jgi:hypothetical protein